MEKQRIFRPLVWLAAVIGGWIKRTLRPRESTPVIASCSLDAPRWLVRGVSRRLADEIQRELKIKGTYQLTDAIPFLQEHSGFFKGDCLVADADEVSVDQIVPLTGCYQGLVLALFTS